jgi:hypothetical protein
MAEPPIELLLSDDSEEDSSDSSGCSESEPESESSSQFDSDSKDAHAAKPKARAARRAPAGAPKAAKRARRAKKALSRPVVVQVEDQRKAAAAALGVEEATLKRILNVARLALTPGTEMEGKNAERALAKSLLKHNLTRADVDKLVKPALMEDLLIEGATFAVTVAKQTRSPWEGNLEFAVRKLLNVHSYYSNHRRGRDHEYVFYGEVQNAHTAAEVFAEAWYTVQNFSAAYDGDGATGSSLRQSRDSYRMGLSDGFYHRCRSVANERKALLARVRDDAEKRATAEREHAAKQEEVAEKMRVQKLREREALEATEEDVKGAPEPVAVATEPVAAESDADANANGGGGDLAGGCDDDDGGDHVTGCDFTFDQVLKMNVAAARARRLCGLDAGGGAGDAASRRPRRFDCGGDEEGVGAHEDSAPDQDGEPRPWRFLKGKGSRVQAVHRPCYWAVVGLTSASISSNSIASYQECRLADPSPPASPPVPVSARLHF